MILNENICIIIIIIIIIHEFYGNTSLKQNFRAATQNYKSQNYKSGIVT